MFAKIVVQLQTPAHFPLRSTGPRCCWLPPENDTGLGRGSCRPLPGLDRKMARIQQEAALTTRSPFLLSKTVGFWTTHKHWRRGVLSSISAPGSSPSPGCQFTAHSLAFFVHTAQAPMAGSAQTSLTMSALSCFLSTLRRSLRRMVFLVREITKRNTS